MKTRQIVLDTETTGLECAEHRIIEIGCVEISNRRLTGNHYHQYLQPDREIDQGAAEVHGITAEFLRDKPRFADIAADFLAFISGAELIIHNAPFDIGFLNQELRRWKIDHALVESHCEVIDTLALARKLHPGQKNNLDALCKRYSIDNSQRALHGALLDAEILADVYLIMTGGQASLTLDAADNRQTSALPGFIKSSPQDKRVVVRASAEELVAHARVLESLRKAAGGECLWDRVVAAEQQE
jgi:DNA polymerase-3 subunit epsilon